MSDTKRLLSLCLSDMSALEALYRLFKQDVFAYAFSIVCDFDTAEECVQETFARLPRAAAGTPDIKNGKAFILSVTRNVAREIFRKNQKYVLTDSDIHTGCAAPPGDELEVLQMLDGLDDDQRQIVVMHVFSGFTFKEIAGITQIKISTVKYKYDRAKQIIKSKVEAER